MDGMDKLNDYIYLRKSGVLRIDSKIFGTLDIKIEGSSNPVSLHLTIGNWTINIYKLISNFSVTDLFDTILPSIIDKVNQLDTNSKKYLTILESGREYCTNTLFMYSLIDTVRVDVYGMYSGDGNIIGSALKLSMEASEEECNVVKKGDIPELRDITFDGLDNRHPLKYDIPVPIESDLVGKFNAGLAHIEILKSMIDEYIK